MTNNLNKIAEDKAKRKGGSKPTKKPDLVIKGKGWWLKKGESMAELRKRAGVKDDK